MGSRSQHLELPDMISFCMSSSETGVNDVRNMYIVRNIPTRNDIIGGSFGETIGYIFDLYVNIVIYQLFNIIMLWENPKLNLFQQSISDI